MQSPQAKTSMRMRSGQRSQESNHKDLSAAAETQARLKPIKKQNRCRAAQGAAPLELVVVGHQLNLRPIAYTVASTALGRSRSVQRPLTKAVRYPTRASKQVQLKVDDGDYVYIYESFPAELWSTQLCISNDCLLVIDEHDVLMPQSLPQQVVDARFLAELLDELLMRDD